MRFFISSFESPFRLLFGDTYTSIRASDAATPETDMLPPDVPTCTFLIDSELSDFVMYGSFSELNCASAATCRQTAGMNTRYFFIIIWFEFYRTSKDDSFLDDN